MSPVRWIHCANRGLSNLLSEALGGDDQWLKDLSELKPIMRSEEVISGQKPGLNWDSDFFQDWQDVKVKNKKQLIAFVNQHVS